MKIFVLSNGILELEDLEMMLQQVDLKTGIALNHLICELERIQQAVIRWQIFMVHCISMVEVVINSDNHKWK